jgi:hypothetical protein
MFSTSNGLYLHRDKCKKTRQPPIQQDNKLTNKYKSVEEALKDNEQIIYTNEIDLSDEGKDSTTFINIVTRPYKKCKISHTMKLQVWDRWIGFKEGMSKCLCCDMITIIQGSFICGHVIAESKSGPTTIDNLRPICFPCNSSMRNENMREFALKHFQRHIK